MSSIEKAMQRQKNAAKTDQNQTSIEAAVEVEKAAKTVAPKVKNSAEPVQTPTVKPKQSQPVVKAKVNKHLGAGISEADFASAGITGDADINTVEPFIEPTTAHQASDNTHISDDKKSKSSRPPLNIDLEALEQRGFVTLRNKRSLINEEYRSIKRKLLSNAFGPISKTIKHSNLILVSSSKPNEGKTFTSLNLALSIALEQDKTVLLVDSDVLKPSVSRELNIGKNVGLIEYLLGEEKDVASIMYHTNIDGLRVIPAGLPHHLSNELLSSDKMMKLIEEFATRYPDRLVVFDAPPLLGVNETAIMAEQCGQGVVVVEEHKSKLADVKKAVDLLPAEMAVGFVINKVTSSSQDQGYGYYYGAPEEGDENDAKAETKDKGKDKGKDKTAKKSKAEDKNSKAEDKKKTDDNKKVADKAESDSAKNDKK